jgi:Phage conserved hypothetical protein BR0599/Uncharacterized conserved protein (DUF2163)
MKNFSPAALAILSAGTYLKYEFWQITLAGSAGAFGGVPNGTTYYFSNAETALTVGGNRYVGGLIFARDRITQKVGIGGDPLELTVTPQADYPGGQPAIGGYTFLSACRAGVFDNSLWLMSKGFFLPPGFEAVTNPSTGYTYTPPPLGNQLDTSPGIASWWAGIPDEIQVGRFQADITLDEATAILKNQQMPRNMVQAGCLHAWGDVGCGVNKAQNTYAGAITGGISGNSIQTNLTPADFVNGYFNIGIITFTSGPLSGASFTVQLSQSASGYIQLIIPFPQAPAIGNSFTIVPGCDKQQSTCASGKFKLPNGLFGSNLPHYRGAPFVPEPETLYDGGTGSQTLSTIGSQGIPRVGSPFTGAIGR